MSQRLETGTYVVRELLKDVALAVEGDASDVRITCVELWGENLYVGTSAGEVLHHVRFPPDPSAPDDDPSFILASRQVPPVNSDNHVGIQQILLMPDVGKACILSNNTLSFYTLPELSPAFGKPLTCGWVGGLDLDSSPGDAENGVVVMLCLKNRIRPVRVGDTPVKLKDIEFASCQAVVRRGNFACVADSKSYALLDVAHQQKVPLFAISSALEQPASTAELLRDDYSMSSGPIARTMTPVDPVRRTLEQERGHRKSSSLSAFRRDGQDDGERSGVSSPDIMSRRNGSRRVSTTDISPDKYARQELGKPLPPPPEASSPSDASASKPPVVLQPLIASPNSELFLLVTGTGLNEPSLGMFVNLDGEVDRGTIEFPNYPEGIAMDGKGLTSNSSLSGEDFSDDGYVLAVVRRAQGSSMCRDIQIQRWDVDASDATKTKEWLNIASLDTSTQDLEIGLQSMNAPTEISMSEAAALLSRKPVLFNANASSKKTLTDIAKREHEESDLFRRLCRVQAHLSFWRGRNIYWLLRNPVVLQLNSKLKLAQSTSIEPNAPIVPQRDLLQQLFNDVRDLKALNELDFYSLSFIKQKIALLLFMDLVLQTISRSFVEEHDRTLTEQALIESELDPRVVVSFLPTIRQEIVQADEGIWLQNGLHELVASFNQQYGQTPLNTDLVGPYGNNLLETTARFLLFWRRKKGNPSVVDGAHVFATVDAAVLLILLQLDSLQPPGLATQGSLRAELYAVVDNGVDCPNRAVDLLEQFNRLYVLSRHYQRRKALPMVLSTWKRILNGEKDHGGELIDGELELRKYLSKLKDRSLVVEYATWLACRNPKLGVQVFADENARVTIPANEALLILRERAPAAVKDFLEHLVFGKKESQHINELIAYYLDIVLEELRAHSKSKTILLNTYETYRALTPPKPTYRQFITDNAIDAEWWHSRLRLLHLLGSNHGPSASYDLTRILDKLDPYIHELVPEMIILNGRQGRHKESLSLLTHDLGDFDTAISYCLLGGSSIFRPPSGYVPEDSLPTHEQQAELFGYLLLEFLNIEDMDSRIERTGELLERFPAWFDPVHVLDLLPDEWAINIFSAFVVNALQRLVREQRETLITKALSMSQNLQISERLIDRSHEEGPVVEK